MGNPSRRADSPGRPRENLSRWPAFPRSPRMALEVGGRSPRVLPLGVLALEHTPLHPPRLTAQAPAGCCVPGLQGVSGPGPTWRGTEPASLSLCLVADALCSHPGVSGGPNLPLRSWELRLTQDLATSSLGPTPAPAPRAMSTPETSGNSYPPCGLPPSRTAHGASQRARGLGTPVATSGLSLRPAHTWSLMPICLHTCPGLECCFSSAHFSQSFRVQSIDKIDRRRSPKKMVWCGLKQGPRKRRGQHLGSRSTLGQPVVMAKAPACLGGGLEGAQSSKNNRADRQEGPAGPAMAYPVLCT